MNLRPPAAEIKAAGIVGFDTESKPTFVTGDVSEGPHVVQFALHDKAYLFQLHRTEGHPFLLDLLQSEDVIKAGFGLRSDRKHIRAKLGVHFNSVVDINTVFSMDGYHKEMGVRGAVGLVLKQRFAKPRHVTTSNWSQLAAHPAANALCGKRCLRGAESAGSLESAPRGSAHHGETRVVIQEDAVDS